MLGIIVGITAVVAVAYRHVERPYDQRFEVTVTEVNHIIDGSIVPVGAIELTDPVRKRTIRGDGLFKFLGCGPDAHCPNINGNWLIPVEEGKEKEFLTDIAKKEGYTVVDDITPCKMTTNERCSVVAKKDDFVLGLTLTPVKGDIIPTTNTGSKVWLSLYLSFDYYWGNDPQWKK